MKEQIEKMRKDLIEIFDEEYEKRRLITPDFTAEKMTAIGYRKQEWIIVEDKFPDVDKILGWDGTAMWFVDAKGICESLQNVISKNGITHWLPIPEPPRMKGENNEKI